ncbi:MAG: hypothetical protein ACK48V_06095 [Crocinitomicaceae bacterium]|jgi:hypothetical protein
MLVSKVAQFLIVSICLFFSLSFFAQDEIEDIDDAIYTRINPKHSLTLELGLPIGLSNKGFKGFLQGMVNFSPYYHYNFKNNISVGVGANYNFFWINHVLSPDKNNVGAIHSLGAFIELGYEKFYTDRIGTDFSVKTGYSQLNFYSVNNRDLGLGTPTKNIAFIEPIFSFIITADEFSSFRWNLGYTFQNYIFNPSSLGFTDAKEYSSDDYQKSTQFFSFGFGYTYYFKQR